MATLWGFESLPRHQLEAETGKHSIPPEGRIPTSGVRDARRPGLFPDGLRGAQRFQAIEPARVQLERVQHLLAQKLGAGGRVPAPLRMIALREHLGRVFADQAQLLALLGAERIGIQMSDEDQLHPEQSTSAIVCHHPQAKYFSV